MDALLVAPPQACGVTYDYADVGEYLGVAYISGFLQQNGINAPILDCAHLGMTNEDAARRIMTANPRVVGITAPFALNLAGACVLAKTLRRTGYSGHICLGGQSAAFTQENILASLPEVDSVCLGEGEETFLELVRNIEAGHSPADIAGLATRPHGELVRRPLIEPLDRLPFPNRVLMDCDGLPSPIHFKVRHRRTRAWGLLASRGCPFNCSFCVVQTWELAKLLDQEKLTELTEGFRAEIHI